MWFRVWLALTLMVVSGIAWGKGSASDNPRAAVSTFVEWSQRKSGDKARDGALCFDLKGQNAGQGAVWARQLRELFGARGRGSGVHW